MDPLATAVLSTLPYSPHCVCVCAMLKQQLGQVGGAEDVQLAAKFTECLDDGAGAGGVRACVGGEGLHNRRLVVDGSGLQALAHGSWCF